MRWAVRLLLCVSLLLLFPLYLLEAHLEDLYDQYRAGAYAAEWWNNKQYKGQDGLSEKTPIPGDKAIVMAKVEGEDTDWVKQELPEYVHFSLNKQDGGVLTQLYSWQSAVYIVNPTQSESTGLTLTTPVNKGHESMAYLTYVIDNYYTLPLTIAFLHSHRSGFLQAWHVDAPLHDNVAAMRALQLNFVQQNGYVNLRCNWNPGCKAGHRRNKHVTEQVWTDIFEGTSTPPLNASESASTAEDSQSHTNRKFLRVPEFVGAACCAQFAVSREQVLQRPRDDYVKIRQWIIDTDKSDAMSGRVMEFLWHVIFGKESV